MDLLEQTRSLIHKDNILWYKKAIAINIYFKTKQTENEKYSQRDAAKDLNISHSYISESLKLAELVVKDPTIRKYTRISALRRLRRE